MNSTRRRLRIPCIALFLLAACPGLAGEQAAWLASRWVSTDLAAIAAASRQWKADHGAWPEDCLAAAAAHLAPAPARDPWGSQYACRLEGGRLFIVSMGPDGRAGTTDDVTLDAESARARGETPAGLAASPAPAAPAAPAPVAMPAPAAEPPSPEALATAGSLQRLAEALESFRRRTGHYPVAEKAEHLERWLVAQDLAPAAWTSQDGWNRPLRYRTTDVGASYTLASAGRDGRWEPLTSAGSSGAGDPDADITVADGKFVRWPAGLPLSSGAMAAAGPATSPGAPSPASEPAATVREPVDPLQLTESRVRRLAEHFAKQGRDGHFIESDDAERLARDLAAPAAAEDGWGRPLHYLSASGGKTFVLVSAGADGRLSTSLEALARGASPAGDDIVARDGKLVGGGSAPGAGVASAP